MPDTKFTWANLREHLRKYIWIYVAGVVVCVFVTRMLWTVTRPRIPDDRSVVVYLMDSASSVEPLDAVARDMLERGQAVDETLQLVEFQSLQYTADDYTSAMLLMTRMSVSEGDAYLASQDGIDALVNAQALLPLDDAVAGGWMAAYSLEPYYATFTDEITGESYTFLAGLRLDGVDALMDMKAFNNRGAYLCLAAGGTNPETTMKVLEIMIDDLTEDTAHAAAESTEPAA